MKKKDHTSIYLSFLLRHHPELIGLHMDRHGWVNVEELLERLRVQGRYQLTLEQLKFLVESDKKGRYRFSPDQSRIKACQGHSISWVKPELRIMEPPKFLYHGTHAEALENIMKSGAISRMGRHAVHLQTESGKAWVSAQRWKGKKPVVLKIAARLLWRDGMVFGCADNGVWCCEQVPCAYITKLLWNQGMEDKR